MRDASGKQAERSEFFCLYQLIFHAGALRYVFHENQAAEAFAVFAEQRSDGNVDDELAAFLIAQVKFVEAGDVLVFGAKLNFGDEIRRKQIRKFFADGSRARNARANFPAANSRIPPCHRARQRERLRGAIPQYFR